MLSEHGRNAGAMRDHATAQTGAAPALQANSSLSAAFDWENGEIAITGPDIEAAYLIAEIVRITGIDEND